LWLQIKADVTGRPVRSIRGDAATSVGAAMLAGVAAGLFADLKEAADRCVVLEPEPILPDPAVAEAYAESYVAYRRLFDRIEEVFA